MPRAKNKPNLIDYMEEFSDAPEIKKPDKRIF